MTVPETMDSFSVAVYLNVRLRQVWQLVTDKKLVPFRIASGGWRFVGAEVEAYKGGLI